MTRDDLDARPPPLPLGYRSPEAERPSKPKRTRVLDVLLCALLGFAYAFILEFMNNGGHGVYWHIVFAPWSIWDEPSNTFVPVAATIFWTLWGIVGAIEYGWRHWPARAILLIHWLGVVAALIATADSIRLPQTPGGWAWDLTGVLIYVVSQVWMIRRANLLPLVRARSSLS